MRAPRVVVVRHAEGEARCSLYELALDVGSDERETLAAALSPDERVRAKRFRFPRDRDRFVVARGMLRRVLAFHGAGAADRLVLIEGRWGKPGLAASPTLHFNVAHSGDRALVAVERAWEVGVDLERVRPVPHLEAVVPHVCAAAEKAALADLPAADRDAAFLRCWVRKEACVKASGIGLRQPLDAFEVGAEVASRVVPIVVRGAGRAEVTLVDVDLGPPYVAALAVAGPRRD